MIRGLHTVDSCANCKFVHRKWNGDNTDTLYCHRTKPPVIPEARDNETEAQADARYAKCERRWKWDTEHWVHENTICKHHEVEKK